MAEYQRKRRRERGKEELDIKEGERTIVLIHDANVESF